MFDILGLQGTWPISPTPAAAGGGGEPPAPPAPEPSTVRILVHPYGMTAGMQDLSGGFSG